MSGRRPATKPKTLSSRSSRTGAARTVMLTSPAADPRPARASTGSANITPRSTTIARSLLETAASGRSSYTLKSDKSDKVPIDLTGGVN